MRFKGSNLVPEPHTMVNSQYYVLVPYATVLELIAKKYLLLDKPYLLAF